MKIKSANKPFALIDVGLIHRWWRCPRQKRFI